MELPELQADLFRLAMPYNLTFGQLLLRWRRAFKRIVRRKGKTYYCAGHTLLSSLATRFGPETKVCSILTADGEIVGLPLFMRN